MIRALFLDRDGIINRDVRYAHKPEHITFYHDIFSLCTKAIERGYEIFVVTNQAGVAKGLFTESDVKALHGWMSDEFKNRGITIKDFYYCPYHPEAAVAAYRRDSDCRKPRPGMFLQAIREHDIDITRSCMVGDKHSDRIELPGLRSIIVKSQYTGEDYDVSSLAEIEELL